MVCPSLGIGIKDKMALQNKKSLGQNWLKDRIILDEIAELARGDGISDSIAETPVCLEIGPGLGTLTSSLLRIFPEVVAVEYDEKLAYNLPKSFPGKNLEVIHADFLKFDLENYPALKKSYVVAGNIPYYITSPIIQKLLEAKNKPVRIVLLVQKEVAERIAAGKGNHTVLSLSVQNKAKVTLGPVVSRELFTPVPKVDSQVIILESLENQIIPDDVFTLIKRGFSAPRKKLIKNLGQVSKDDLLKIFEQIGMSRDVRPADLDLEDWQKIATLLTE